MLFVKKKRPAGTAGRAIMYVMYLRAIELEGSGNRIALGFNCLLWNGQKSH
jgi:hypothetical protein